METALQQKSCCLHYCHHVSFSPIASSQPQVGSDCERFDRCAAVCCDSALIRWRSIAGSLQGRKSLQSSAEFHLFVKVPDSCARIKDHLQAEGNECSGHFRWGAAVPTSQSKHFPPETRCVCQWKSRSQRWDILQCDSSEIVIVIIGFLVAAALETQRFTGTNILVCFCRAV